MENKEAKQLRLALGDLPTGVRKGDVARSIPADQSSLTHWANSDRRMSHEVMKPISNFLQNVKFAFSASRKDYGTLSFKDDGKVKEDLFAAWVDLNQQEEERIEIQKAAFVSASKPDEHKTSKDWENINRMDKEFPEEISAKLTFLFTWCEYTGVDAMEIIKQINEQIGG